MGKGGGHIQKAKETQNKLQAKAREFPFTARAQKWITLPRLRIRLLCLRMPTLSSKECQKQYEQRSDLGVP